MSRVTLLILFSVALIIVATATAILFARGYNFDFGTKQLTGTGILVATSDPNGAQVRINGALKTATNNTINLPPGDYTIKLELDGYSSWEKKVTIKAEEVYKTNAFLFPRVPDLRPLTLNGAQNPTLAPDQTRIAYYVSSASAEKNGIWIFEMGKSFIPTPLPIGADSHQIYQQSSSLLPLSEAKFLWSTDSRQLLVYLGDQPTLSTPNVDSTTPILATSPSLCYLLEADRINSTLTPLSTTQLAQTLVSWQDFATNQKAVQMSKLKPAVNNFLKNKTSNPRFSPDETKILYQATASATLSPVLNTYLPGSDPTPESRTISPGGLYVYDTKEDKNFLISQSLNHSISWFPSSRHLLEFTDKEISVMEYDGTNKSIVYAGPFIDSYIYAYPNWSKIVILTSLNQAAGIGENLYTINLR